MSSVSKKLTDDSSKVSFIEVGSFNFLGEIKFMVTSLYRQRTLHKECTALPYLRSPIRAILKPSMDLFFDSSSFLIV